MIFLVRYSRLLEESSFRGRVADFTMMILFGGTCVAYHTNLHESHVQLVRSRTCNLYLVSLAMFIKLPALVSERRMHLSVPLSSMASCRSLITSHAVCGRYMCCLAPFVNIPPFLGSSLAFMMVRFTFP